MVNVLLYNGDVCSAHQGHTNSPKATIDRDPIKISLQSCRRWEGAALSLLQIQLTLQLHQARETDGGSNKSRNSLVAEVTMANGATLATTVTTTIPEPELSGHEETAL